MRPEVIRAARAGTRMSRGSIEEQVQCAVVVTQRGQSPVPTDHPESGVSEPSAPTEYPSTSSSPLLIT